MILPENLYFHIILYFHTSYFPRTYQTILVYTRNTDWTKSHDNMFRFLSITHDELIAL